MRKVLYILDFILHDCTNKDRCQTQTTATDRTRRNVQRNVWICTRSERTRYKILQQRNEVFFLQTFYSPEIESGRSSHKQQQQQRGEENMKRNQHFIRLVPFPKQR